MITQSRRSPSLAWYYKNKENRTQAMKEWGIKNREKRTEYRKKYRATPKGKEKTLQSIRKYETTHPERRNAWNQAQQLEARPCIICGKKAHKHHPNPLQPLEITYLCPLHHKQTHMV